MTEPTEDEKVAPTGGWLLYDADCSFCTSLARRFTPWANRRGFAVLPLQTRWVREKLGLRPDEPAREMVVLKPDGRSHGGADALLELARAGALTRPLAALGRIGFIHRLLDRAYRWIAKRRACLSGACGLAENAKPPATLHGSLRQFADWFPVFTLPALALATMHLLPPWAFMWTLAGAIFLGAKWLTWRDALHRGATPNRIRSLGYFFAWPGMNAAAFLRSDLRVNTPDSREWPVAAIKTSIGAILLWGGAPMVPPSQPLLAGWIGMIGLILLLHFGVFHLLSLAWRTGGVQAPPIMQRPLTAQSVGEFWSRRWNGAFHELVHRHVFRPSVRVGGATFAVFAVFGLSGLLHEFVISLPARGGFGLPTLYFLLQGLAVLVERTAIARRYGIGRGFRGWLFTVICTAGPIGALFHPVLVREVILPFLRVMGAL